MQPRRRQFALLGVAFLAGLMAGGGAQASLALLTDTESVDGTFTTASSFGGDTVPPTVSSSVISKTVPYIAGYVRQGGTYYVYANVTDSGTPTSGVSTVTADVSTVTAGQTAVALVAGSYSAYGVSYNYRSASVIAGNPLSEGSKAYTITAIDVVGNSVTQGGFSVTVDNTAPSRTDVQTANVGGGTAGRPELGDMITFTFSEVIDPESVLAGWTGAATNVVVQISNNAGGDRLTIWNAANSAQLPFGRVDLNGAAGGATAYVTASRNFGASGTPSTMIQSGASILITLGTASGAVGTETVTAAMRWETAVSATDRAGNTCTAADGNEAAPLDVEF